MDINRDTLKEYLEKGDRPTEEQFIDLVDSQVNKVDDQVHVVGLKPNVQIGLGTPPNDLGAGPGLLRLFVDQRFSTKELKIRGDGLSGPNTPSPGKLLFATDATGNTKWGDQTSLDQNHWVRASFTDANSKMWAKPTGNIGIGTDSPTSKLTLSGPPQLGEKGLGLHVFNKLEDVGSKASVSLFVEGTKHRWEMTSETMQTAAGAGKRESAFKLRRFTDGSDTTVAATYLWINDNTNSIHFNTQGNTGPAGEYILWGGNVGIGINPTAKLHVAGAATIDGLTKTNSLQIFPLPGLGSPTGDVLMVDGTGLVKKVPANTLQAAGHELWTDNGSNLDCKPNRGAVIPLSLSVGDNLRLDNGVIQKGGAHITATDDLGLYSLTANRWMRFVTNAQPIKFFAGLGTNNTGDGIEPVVEMYPNYVNITENLNLKDNQNFTIGWKFPFMVNTFKITDNGSGQDDAWYRSTGVLVDEYPVAAVIGFKTTGWVSNMGGDPGADFFVTCRPKNGQWEIVANIGNAPGDDSREENDWHVDVMFTYRGIVEVGADYRNRIYSV